RLTCLGFAILCWAQVIDTPPFHSRLRQLQRVAYVLGAMTVSWVLALVLVFAAGPIYPYYAAVASTPHVIAGILSYTDPAGLTALEDQQLAGGIMWVPGCSPVVVGGVWFACRVLGERT